MNKNEIKDIEEKKLAQQKEKWRDALLNYISDYSDEEERKKNAAVIELMYSNLNINEQKQFKRSLKSDIDAYEHKSSISYDDLWFRGLKLDGLEFVQNFAHNVAYFLNLIAMPGMALLIGAERYPSFTAVVVIPLISLGLFVAGMLSIVTASPLPFCLAVGVLIVTTFVAQSLRYSKDYCVKANKTLSEKISDEKNIRAECKNKLKETEEIISKFHECEKIVEGVDEKNRESYTANTAKRMASNFFGSATIVPPDKKDCMRIISNYSQP